MFEVAILCKTVPGGTWSGYLQTLNHGGTQKKVLIDFQFNGNEITGRGSDDSQEFKVKGTINKQDGTVNIEIVYDKMKLEVILNLKTMHSETAVFAPPPSTAIFRSSDGIFIILEVCGTLSLDFHFKVNCCINVTSVPECCMRVK